MWSVKEILRIQKTVDMQCPVNICIDEDCVVQLLWHKMTLEFVKAEVIYCQRLASHFYLIYDILGDDI